MRQTGAITVLLGLLAAQAVAAPFKLFDTHLHPIADDTERYPRVIAGPPAHGVGKSSIGIGGRPDVPKAATDIEGRVLTWMDEQGVDGIAAIQKRGSYGTDNRYLLAMSDAHPDRLNAVVILDAEDEKTSGELRDMIAHHHLAGLRLTGGPSAAGTYPWLSSPQALKAWAIADAAGIVVDIMITNEDNSEHGVPELLKLAKAYSHVRVVLDHVLFPKVAGAPSFGINAAYASMAQQKNIYYKLTTINLDIQDAAHLSPAAFVRHVVDVYGADHVMWGSDAGNSSGSYPELIERMRAACAQLTDPEKRKVLHDTGKRVFVRGGARSSS